MFSGVLMNSTDFNELQQAKASCPTDLSNPHRF